MTLALFGSVIKSIRITHAENFTEWLTVGYASAATKNIKTMTSEQNATQPSHKKTRKPSCR